MNPAGTAPRGAGTAGSEPAARRVVLVSESSGLAAVLSRLLDRSDRLTRVASPGDLAGRAGPIDLVVLDVPPEGRRAMCEQVRRRHPGPMIVLVDQDDGGHGLPPDDARTLLTRPFVVADLATALRDAGVAPREMRAGVTPIGIAARRPESLRRPTRPAPAAADTQPAGHDTQPAGHDTQPAAPLPGPATALPRGPAAAPPPGPAAAAAATSAASETTQAASSPTAAAEGAGGEAAQPAGQAAWFTTAAEEANASAQAWEEQAATPVGTGAADTATARRWPLPRRPPVLLGRIVHAVRTRRRLQLAAIGGLAVVAFLAAFAIAAQNRCGPGCDSLIGGSGATQPTVAPSASVLGGGSSPSSSASGAQPTQTTTRGPGQLGGVVGGVAATTTSSTRASAPATTSPSRTTRTTRPTTTSRPGTTTTTTTTTPPTTTTTAPAGP